MRLDKLVNNVHPGLEALTAEIILQVSKGNNEVQRLTTELAVESGKFREDMLSSMKRKICAVAIENLVDVKVEEERLRAFASSQEKIIAEVSTR